MRTKKLITIFLILSCFLNIKAQDVSNNYLEISPFIGYMQTFFNGDSLEALEERHVTRFGVNIDCFFYEKWSFKTGVNYDSMGTRSFNSVVVLNYINVPINANWHFGNKRKWNLNFGITSGFLLNARSDGTNIENEVEDFQLAISCGIGYKVKISKIFSVLFDLQGLVGLTNIINEDVVGLITRKNMGSSFNIGGVFKL